MKLKRLTRSIIKSINLPASKSESNRALIINAIANSLESKSMHNLSLANDTKVLTTILKSKKNRILDVGHAGTAMRFLTAYYATIINSKVILTGSERMQNRPIKVLVDALKELGAKINYLDKEGYPPLEIKGNKLEGGLLEIDASVSSQYISALLMIAPVLDKGLDIELKGVSVSQPYITMTINLMEYYGVKVIKENNSFKIKPQKYILKPITIESDWSAASYWYQIAALSSSCQIKLIGLTKKSRQGDQDVLRFYKEFGVETLFLEDGIILTKKATFLLNKDKAYHFNLEDTPDLAQALICTCAGLGVEATFLGLSTLKIKETDRLKALRLELNKVNIELSIIDDSKAFIAGKQIIKTPVLPIETYQDHRMAMCFAPLTLVIKQLEILNPEVVKKSYPNFWRDLEGVFDMEI